MTLVIPVSSSSPRKVTPSAVAGRCRCVTIPATSTRLPSGAPASPAVVYTPRSSRYGRACTVGYSSGLIPVAARSADVSSTMLIPGSAGASTWLSPGSIPGRSRAAVAADHSAARRPPVPRSSRAPAVARASICRTVSPVRDARSAALRYGPCRSRSSAIAVASSSPTALTESSPSRTSVPAFSHVACPSERLTHGRCTGTPCRRASATSDCGE